MRKFFAFTLAETLIVMGIIGIVSALTLPNLNSSTGEKEKIAKVKKIYQNLDDAIGRAIGVYGPIDEWFVNDTSATSQTARFGERVTEFMKVSKVCGMTANQGCFNLGNLKNGISGISTNKLDSGSFYKVITADGTSLSFRRGVISGAMSDVVYIDIDGPQKGPYTFGTDVFEFKVYENTIPFKVEPEGESWDPNFTSCLENKNSACTHWIIANDNMDYLKADKTGKCPNGTVLSETVTSCK